MYVTVDTCPGLKPIRLYIEAEEFDNVARLVFQQLPSSVANNSYLTHRGGQSLDKYLLTSHTELLDLRLNTQICGGKGGFGSQLRAQGGKMAAARRRRQRASSRERAMEQDSFRTLDGRRMRSVRQAKELAEYLDSAPGIARQQRQAKIDKLKAIINTNHSSTNARFSDVNFLEETERTIDEIRDSVNAVMSEESTGSSSSSSITDVQPDTPPSDDTESKQDNTKGKEIVAPKFVGFFGDDDDDSDGNSDK